jgi:hypothetical protein
MSGAVRVVSFLTIVSLAHPCACVQGNEALACGCDVFETPSERLRVCQRPMSHVPPAGTDGRRGGLASVARIGGATLRSAALAEPQSACDPG